MTIRANLVSISVDCWDLYPDQCDPRAPQLAALAGAAGGAWDRGAERWVIPRRGVRAAIDGALAAGVDLAIDMHAVLLD